MKASKIAREVMTWLEGEDTLRVSLAKHCRYSAKVGASRAALHVRDVQTGISPGYCSHHKLLHYRTTSRVAIYSCLVEDEPSESTS